MMSSRGEIAHAFRDVVSAIYAYEVISIASGIDDDKREALLRIELMESVQKVITFMIVAGQITRSSNRGSVVSVIAGMFNLKLDHGTVAKIATIVNDKLRERGKAPIFIDE